MRLLKISFFLILICSFYSQAQSTYVLDKDSASQKIRFELINNVIIIPVEVNGISLKFLLDTGVSKPIVFNFLKASDSLKVLNAEKIKLKGLGDGDYIDALRSSHNTFKIGNAINTDQTFFAIFDPRVNFAPKLGIAIDGIIGYDLFKDFIVEINYSNRFIRLHQPDKYTYKSCKKCETFNLEFNNNKPYLDAKVLTNGKDIPVKMLIDSGSSDAIWLFEDDEKDLTLSKNYFYDFLGSGLSGNVFGKRTKIDALKLKQFVLENPKAAFPDSVTIASVKKFKDRDGTLGGEVLRRFNCIVDYTNSKLTLKPNYFFKKKFSYNKSGLQIEHDGVRVIMEFDVYDNSTTFNPNSSGLQVKSILAKDYKYSIKPAYRVFNVIKNSPAYKAGLQKGDVIFEINGKSTHDMTLNNLVGYFYQKEGTRIKLVVDRLGKNRKFEFNLESPIK
ncbi:aspartyl protease family protein [Olleya sp. YS]|uniref:aspartyl protease family protein n=1 Tax=Olleya sp. YS TaxID=3028318 RepID=UPI0024345C32|nr:aspartyl protease family protein [Olleya sp. YS]WGD33722.1 aspartyl protease family protein [Olleya sp. YS]